MSYVSRVINPDRLSVLEHLGAPLALVGLTDVDEQHTGDGGMGSTPRGTFCWANPACYRILNGHPLQGLMQQCLQVLELEGVSRHVMILDREQKSVDVTRTKVTLEAHNDSWRQLAASSPNNPSWAAGLGNFPVGTSAALLCELQLVVKSATSKRSRASADTASRQSLEAAASMLPHVALLLFRADGLLVEASSSAMETFPHLNRNTRLEEIFRDANFCGIDGSRINLREEGPLFLGRVIKQGETIRLQRSQGAAVHDVALSQRVDEQGRAVMLVALHDVSPHHRLAAAAARSDLDRRDAARPPVADPRHLHHVVQSLTRVLRNPLTSVMATTNLLQASQLGGDTSLGPIRDSTNELLTILNQVHEYTKVHAGQGSFPSMPFDVINELMKIMEILSPKAREKGLGLSLVCLDRDFPCTLQGSHARLRQMLGNLVANSIKYTARGQVIVEVANGAEAAGGAAVLELSVADTGTGVAPEDLHHIFEPFWQSDSATATGAGLGLSLCQLLGESMHGTFNVQSQLGVGTRISCTVRLEEVPEMTERETKVVQGQMALLANTTVLVFLPPSRVDPGEVARSPCAQQMHSPPPCASPFINSDTSDMHESSQYVRSPYWTGDLAATSSRQPLLEQLEAWGMHVVCLHSLRDLHTHHFKRNTQLHAVLVDAQVLANKAMEHQSAALLAQLSNQVPLVVMPHRQDSLAMLRSLKVHGLVYKPICPRRMLQRLVGAIAQERTITDLKTFLQMRGARNGVSHLGHEEAMNEGNWASLGRGTSTASRVHNEERELMRSLSEYSCSSQSTVFSEGLSTSSTSLDDLGAEYFRGGNYMRDVRDGGLHTVMHQRTLMPTMQSGAGLSNERAGKQLMSVSDEPARGAGGSWHNSGVREFGRTAVECDPHVPSQHNGAPPFQGGLGIARMSNLPASQLAPAAGADAPPEVDFSQDLSGNGWSSRASCVEPGNRSRDSPFHQGHAQNPFLPSMDTVQLEEGGDRLTMNTAHHAPVARSSSHTSGASPGNATWWGSTLPATTDVATHDRFHQPPPEPLSGVSAATLAAVLGHRQQAQEHAAHDQHAHPMSQQAIEAQTSQMLAFIGGHQIQSGRGQLPHYR